MSVTMIPFLVLLIILVLVFIPAFSPMMRSKRIGFLSMLNFKLLAGIYCLLLLVSLCIFYLLPTDTFSSVDEEFGQVDVEEMDQYRNSIYEALYKGDIEETEGIIKNKQWEFPISGEKLTLTMNEEHSSLLVLAERSNELDGKIVATYYTMKSYIDGISFSEQLNSPTIKLQDDNLVIIDPEPLELHFYKLKKEFPITQFNPDKREEYMMETTIGVNVLYVKVPENLEVIGNIQFVEK
ncbi:hypothetical protein [Bacillus pinisoli]|uniref:hypothetical protein n=1 Tax=Bacillus pinisoli TaxID=2901866 RepID=UPI001FF4E301|nr:hypothetical protein [Bacillus pinisoli]